MSLIGSDAVIESGCGSHDQRRAAHLVINISLSLSCLSYSAPRAVSPTSFFACCSLAGTPGFRGVHSPYGKAAQPNHEHVFSSKRAAFFARFRSKGLDRDSRSAPASPDRVCACLCRSFLL